MSQPRGRYPGPRDRRPRQSHQPSDTVSHRPNKPYAKASPAREAEHTASIFKTRSFKWLVDTVGAENIALGLDSSLSRVTELTNGVKFTPETAFHIETTLGLPDGFFDQPNPALTAEIIDRLKAPLDFAYAHAEYEPESVALDAVAPILANNALPADHLPRETDMPKKTHDVSQPVVAKTSPSRAKPAGNPASKPASKKVGPSVKRGAQQSLLLNDETPLQDIRRANLHVLTSRKGSKVRLAVVMEISASNLDNRLYGQKRMDDAEASRFTDRLGLPAAWLDVPRVATDIPEAVSALLDPQADHPVSDPTPFAVTQPEATTVAKKSAPRKTKVQSNSDAPPSDANANSKVVITQLAKQQEPALVPDVELPVIQTAEVEVLPPASPQQPELTSIIGIAAQQLPRSAPATSLDDLIGIEPIAEALIKTLAGKARTGRLDEMKALALLQQIVAL